MFSPEVAQAYVQTIVQLLSGLVLCPKHVKVDSALLHTQPGCNIPGSSAPMDIFEKPVKNESRALLGCYYLVCLCNRVN